MKTKKKFDAMNFIGRYGILIILVVIFIAFSVINENFLTTTNIINLLRQNCIEGIICVSMSMVIITGGIDLSVGSIVGVASVYTAYLLLYGVPWPVAVIIIIAGGLACGLINGFFINELQLPPFIATLGMMTALRGVAYVATNAIPVTGFPDSLDWIGKGSVLSIPVPAIIMAVVFFLGWLFLEKTRYGTYVYGIGGNEEATRLSGVNPKLIKYIVYGLNGALSALAGIVLMSRVNGGQPKGGDGYEMDVITAVVLGGVSMSGGEGKILFVLVGVFFMGILSNGLIMMGVNDYWQQVVSGLVLIGAVAFDKLMQRAKAKRVTE